MSSTLVHTIPVSPLLAHHHNPAHPHLAIPIPGPITRVHARASPPQLSHNEKCLAQLAPLASQHHRSEYNRMKFGPQGCPMAYTPLSIQCPDYIKGLQSNPLYVDHQSWYICPQSPSRVTKEHEPIILGPSGSPTESVGTLQLELEAAMEAPLSDNPQKQLEMPTSSKWSPQNTIKTSSTHPINVSTLIPIELLPIISAHLTHNRTPTSPVLFDLPPAYTLDRITSYPHPPPPPTSPPSLPLPSLPPLTSTTPLSGPAPSIHLRGGASVSEALQAAINSGIAAAAAKAATENSPAFGIIPRTNSTPTMTMSMRPTLRTSNSTLSSISQTKNVDDIKTPLPLAVQALEYVSQPSQLPKSPQYSTIKLGNMLLSSCPGKKVRLSGPVKGRSGVNRDLYTDLKRFHALNVRLVICLLSDDELSFLGAPWLEYQSACADIGLDVLRLPIPEGLPPPSAKELDEVLGRVITGWSIKGVNVLVHCRGGVGRAGLLGCCWALKLGLCGWIETGDYASPATPGVRRDTMQLLERMVGSIRRRRSVKAIETYEQVRFLMEFVEYLRGGKAVGL